MHRGVLVTGLVTAVITIATAGPTAAQDATVSPGIVGLDMAGVVAADPLRLVAGLDALRVTTIGEDRLDVWACTVSEDAALSADDVLDDVVRTGVA